MCLPLRFLIWIAAWSSIFLAIGIASTLQYAPWARMLTAYAIWEGAAIILSIIRVIIFWVIKKLFFWLVDIIPVKGSNIDESREMVLAGPLSWLGKKFGTEIENWADSDTEQLASLFNWRAKLFFHAKGRLRKRVDIFKAHHEMTGQEPDDLTEIQRNELVGHLEYRRFERWVINPFIFNALLRIGIIIIAILWLDSTGRQHL
jgi:hypothetical protein